MKLKPKRITIALLAVVLAAAFIAGLLCALLPNRTRFADELAELNEDDFEYGYVSSLAYGADTEQTSGDNGVYGWGYENGDKEHANYAYITKIDNEKLDNLKARGVTKLVLNIPATHGKVPVKFVQQNAFNNCDLTITDINLPLSVYWQIEGNKSLFEFNNNSSFARADGLTATFTGFKPASGSGITTLILPSNVWIDKDNDKVMDANEPTYRYTEYLFEGNSGAPYTNLVVMPDVVNIFNGKGDDHPKLQGGLLSKSKNLKSVNFCTGRSEILHLYPLTFENCTSLTEISLSAGVYLEDGARVFQGSSALEKFFVAEEKKASAPLFYTVGADGALYTNDYAYDYFSQTNTEKYYEWWNNGNPKGYENELAPTKVFDSQNKIAESRLTEDHDSSTGEKANCTFKGDTSATTPTAQIYYEQSDGKNIGVGIPENSFVFDAVKNETTGSNDFAGLTAGNIQSTAFHLHTKSGAFQLTRNAQTVSITTGSKEFDGNETTYQVNGKTYTSQLQLKKGSQRILKITTSFDFDISAYFAGAYKGTEANGNDKPYLALWQASDVKNATSDSYTANYSQSVAQFTTEEEDIITAESGDKYITPLVGSELKAGTYYLAQPSDDKNNSGMLQLLFIVITPLKEQTASSLVVEQQITPMHKEFETYWEPVQNDAVLLSGLSDNYNKVETYIDRRHTTMSFKNDSDSNKMYFRMKLLSEAGEVIKSQDIQTHVMKVDGTKMYTEFITLDDTQGDYHFAVDKEGYFHFYSVFIDEGDPDDEFYPEPEDKIKFKDGNESVIGSLGPNGLPCGVGVYEVDLDCLDPKSAALDRDRSNIECCGEGNKGYNCSVRLYIIDKNQPFTDGDQYWDSDYIEDFNTNNYKDFFTDCGDPMTIISDHANSFTYRGAPITLEEVFANPDGTEAKFNERTTVYSLTRDGVPVTEVKDVGTYVMEVTPADGFVWWRGYGREENDKVVWGLDQYWKKLGGTYEDFKKATLTFTFTVDPKPITIPKDTYVPTEFGPPYAFPTLIGGDYEVVGYSAYEEDYEGGILPAVGSSAWSADAPYEDNKIYGVLLRLTDPKNCVWSPNAGESHGGNFYVKVRLYAGFLREKEYPTFVETLGNVESGETDTGIHRTLTFTYDGKERGIETLFATAGRPTYDEANYSIVKLTGEPESAGSIHGEAVNSVRDAGYYGIVVTLNDPFLYTGTTETVAYYVVHIEEAEITAKEADDTDFEWAQKRLFSVDDEGVELKLPDDFTDARHPLNIINPDKNDVTVTYYLVTHKEGEHDDMEDPEDVVDALNAGGEDPFEGKWYVYSDDQLKVKMPGGYCAYVKVEAANHKTYYNYISLHIFHEELTITLKSSVGNSAVYGESVHTQSVLRTAVFNAIDKITVSSSSGDITETDKTEALRDKQDYFFFYFTKDGREYDIDETTDTYLDVGKYELQVRYSGPAIGSEEETEQYINFIWAGGAPEFEITRRELTLDLGAITGHTYLSMPAATWYEKETLTYTADATKEAIVKRNGVADDLKLSYQFKLGTQTFKSLNAISNAGDYTVEAVCGNPNYEVSLNKTYTYKVAARELTLNEIASVSYDGNEHKPVISFTGLPENIVLLEGKDYNLSYLFSSNVTHSFRYFVMGKC